MKKKCFCQGTAWPCAVCGAPETRFYHGGLVWICREHDWPERVDDTVTALVHQRLHDAGIDPKAGYKIYDELVEFTEDDYAQIMSVLRN